MAGAVVVGDGKSDDIVAAPVPIPPSSDTNTRPPSGDSAARAGAGGGVSTASTVALAVLALIGGVGAGIILKARVGAQPRRLPQT
jgi:hypothetical protein